MTLSEFLSIITISSTIPVRYRVFSTPVNPPFIVYYEDGSNNFIADNKVYKPRTNLRVELYTSRKDTATEASLESAFNTNEIIWQKTEAPINEEKLHMTAYAVEGD